MARSKIIKGLKEAARHARERNVPPRVIQADFDKLDEIRAEIEDIREFDHMVREKYGIPPRKVIE